MYIGNAEVELTGIFRITQQDTSTYRGTFPLSYRLSPRQKTTPIKLIKTMPKACRMVPRSSRIGKQNGQSYNNLCAPLTDLPAPLPYATVCPIDGPHPCRFSMPIL